ncbi:MAG TPA: DUF502 domain-containing protein [Longimicrobiales bacterium]
MSWGAVKRRLIAGLVVIAPVTITAAVLWWIFQSLDGLLGNIIYPAIGVEVPGLGLLLLLAVLLCVGWLAERALGARVVAWWHTLLERFPLTRRVYTASNRIVRTVFGEDQRFFREVVIVEYPGPGRWSLGFLTAGAPTGIHDVVPDGVTVFIPTTPNPTTGYLVVVDRKDVTRLPWTLEQAFTFILSAGGVSPELEGATAGEPRNAEG